MSPRIRPMLPVLVLAIAGCAAPGASAPSESSETMVSVSTSAAPSTAPGSAESASASPTPGSPTASTPTDSAPTTTSPTASPSAAASGSVTSSEPTAQPSPGPGSWPPLIIPGDILEAGITTVTEGKVSVQLPAGFAAAATGGYTSTMTGASGPATITVSAASAPGGASSALAAAGSWARQGAVSISGSTDAAMAEAVVDGVQTWALAVVDSTGQATTITWTANQADFDAYLLPQSLSSVKVSA